MGNLAKSAKNLLNLNPTKMNNCVFFALFIILVVLYLWHIGNYELINPDEGRYAEIPREMLATGNFITPHLNGVEYFEKPALQYWITAFFMYVLGENEFAVRLFPALCAVGGIFTTSYLAKCMFNRQVAFFSATVLGSSFLYLIIGSLNILDMGVSFFLTLSLMAFYLFSTTNKRKWLYLCYIAMALGTLTKGLIAIVLTIAVVFVYLICTKQFKMILKAISPVGIIIFAAITVPWFYLVCRDNPDFFYFFFIQEHFLRYLTKMHDRYQPFYFFIPCIILGIFPWTGFLLTRFSPKKLLDRLLKSPQGNAYIYLILWFGIIFVFYSMSDSKLVPYIVPCLPPLAILIATRLAALQKTSADDVHKQLIVPLSVNTFFSLAIIIALTVTVLRSDFITMREFILFGMPLILVLAVSSLLNLFFWYKKRSVNSIIAVSIISSILFCFSLQPVMSEVAEHRTGKAVAQVVNEWKDDNSKIICYKDYVQDLPFYTKERVIIYDYLGELEFGSQHLSGQGWFLNERDQLMNIWYEQDNPSPIMVAPAKMKAEILSFLPADTIEYTEVDKYLIIKKK